jgi:large subunit ribosomal protein L4
LASALSDRLASERIVVLKDWGIDTPSTKQARELLAKLEVTGRVLVVLTREDEAVWKSLRNLPQVHVLDTQELNAYDVLVSDWMVFTEESLPKPKAAKAEKPAADDEADS